MPFSREFARGIREMQAPEGVVFAIDGSWVSGKTSVINLIKEELEREERETIKVVSYAPWLVKGTNAVILGFLQSLYAATDLPRDFSSSCD
jgi:predicted KAP-like P-loop ATPase